MSVDRMAARVLAAKASPELDDLVREVAVSSPYIEGKSAFIRHGVRLALEESLELDLIHDNELRTRIRTYLDRQAVAIGEPLGRN